MKVRQFYRTPLRVALLLSYTLTANLPPLCRAGALVRKEKEVSEKSEEFLAKMWIVLGIIAFFVWLSMGSPGVTCGGSGGPCANATDKEACYDAIEDSGRFGQ